jgi:glycosyltransferase involved in cell wall biosynthesis
LVHLPDALFVGLAREIKRRLRRPVVCTLTGEDILLDKLGVEYKLPALELIRRRQSDVDAFIAVTRYYAGYCVENFGIPSEKVHYVPMGVKIDYESGSEKMSFVPGSDVFTIGYLARICPEKGLHLLCEAFLILRNQRRTCRLKVGGYLGSSDRPYFEAIQRRLHAAGYGDAVEYDGEVDREGKLRLLRSLDALSVPTVYREAKGLYVLEAMAQSVPVVQPRHGSFPELVEATGGGILVNPEDPADLARGIAQLMDDAALCHQLGEQAHRVVARQFTDTVMADEAWKVFEQARANYK